MPGGDEIIPVVNKIQDRFELIVATQDWHPREHVSFASTHGKKAGETIETAAGTQMLWPEHCVQDTWGAEFHPKLDTAQVQLVVKKGTEPDIDSYSAFFDNQKLKSTGLDRFLAENKVDSVYIVGLATDVCVKFTALDAADLGLVTYVIKDACQGVDLNPGDVDRAYADMLTRGIKVLSSKELK